MTTQYQVWIENDDYSKSVLLNRYRSMRYRQVLNDIGYAEVEMHPDDAKVSYIDIMKRLRIIRNGITVFGGIVLRIGWEIPDVAPSQERWTFYALDQAVYADWRIVVPQSGYEHDERSGAADDVLKAYVYYHAGAGAASDRQFPDLTVEANEGAASYITYRARYDSLLNVLRKCAEAKGVDWRFVPQDSGCEFQTAVPWGVDRTKGNGVNTECVFSVDRRDFLGQSWVSDALGHYNYMYVAGQGAGVDRNVVERYNSGHIATYKRRERLVDARQLSLTSSLEARGDAEIAALAVIKTATVKPRAEFWQATSGTTFDLGDKVTIYVHRHGSCWSYDGKIIALTVEVAEDGTETVTPDLEAC